MAYKILSFDNLTVPTYLQSGDAQNIGSGDALVSFVQLAGGGFFDNYASSISPRAVQPITRQCVILGTSKADRKDTLDNWRAKIGVRGKLYVEYDDGTQRWQWARLRSVNAPRDEGNKAWLPVTLSWVTADQWWRGTAHPEEGWVWGDGSWTFGDATATFGEDFETFTLDANPDSFSLTNGGNIDANDLRISIIPSEAMSYLEISNSANASVIGYTATVTAGQELIIDTGAMSVTVNGENAFVNFFKIQASAPWMPLAPGANSITVEYTAADSLNGDDILFSWTDAWA